MTFKIRSKILISIICTVFFTLIVMSLNQYLREVEILEEQIKEKAELSLLPIMAFAQRGIDGANIMLLRNKEAQSLYKIKTYTSLCWWVAITNK